MYLIICLREQNIRLQKLLMYDVTVSPAGGAVNATIPTSTTADTTFTASFTNDYSEVQSYTGTLVIRKTITGDATLAQIGTISFTAVCGTESLNIPDLKTSTVGTVVGTNWIDEGNGVYTFTVSGLDQGKTYVVTEIADGHNTKL